jgi:hypothetical protein
MKAELQVLTIIVSTLICGCRDTRIWDPPAPDSHPTLAEQKMCLDQAEKAFKTWPDQEHLTMTNHYDPVQKVCYMETTSRFHTGKVFDYGHQIVDAFEGRGYASFISATPPDTIVECYLQPRGKTKIPCHSSDEFDALALKYFGTTQD